MVRTLAWLSMLACVLVACGSSKRDAESGGSGTGGAVSPGGSGGSSGSSGSTSAGANSAGTFAGDVGGAQSAGGTNGRGGSGGRAGTTSSGATAAGGAESGAGQAGDAGAAAGDDTCPGDEDDDLRVIEGNVTVATQEEVNALAAVGEVTGALWIGNPVTSQGPEPMRLDSLAPLSCLRVVGGTFTLYYVAGPRTLDALRSFESVGALQIVGTDLEDIDALQSTTSAQLLTISDNDRLRNVDGLRSLTHAGNVSILSNAALANLDGLSALTNVDAWLYLQTNAVLANVDGLAALTSIGENLWIDDNAALLTLRGLHALDSVGGGLSITDNASLPECEAVALRGAIGSVTGTVTIESNSGIGSCSP